MELLMIDIEIPIKESTIDMIWNIFINIICIGFILLIYMFITFVCAIFSDAIAYSFGLAPYLDIPVITLSSIYMNIYGGIGTLIGIIFTTMVIFDIQFHFAKDNKLNKISEESLWH